MARLSRNAATRWIDAEKALAFATGREIRTLLLSPSKIAEKLDEFGIHYIEGGYPGSNPKDKEFFERARKMRWKNSVMCAFGMTRRVGKKVDEDANMKALVAAGTPVITVVGKSWDFHVIEALRTTLEENLHAVKDTVAYLKKNADKVIEYKKGKKGLLALFVGEVMKRSKGKADPRLTNELIIQKLQS